MTWIKENKFAVALGGITLLGVIVLAVVGMKGSSRYAAAKQEFEAAAADASSYERQSLYPKDENRQGKDKALAEYKQATADLQKAFEPYRPKELANISPQAFTDQLKTVNDKLVAAFNEAGTKVPDEFFSGFERYKTTLASGDATGILKYQLDGIGYVLQTLAESGVTELRNVHRVELPEESGRKWSPPEKQVTVARPLPVEIAFVGPEKAARKFLSSIAKPDPHFIVIRSLRIANTKKEPPMASDAKFENQTGATASGAPGAADVANIFGEAFGTPDTEAAGEGAVEQPAAPPKPKVDSSQILAQVLGKEEVQVHVRLDLMQFLPAKKLP